MFDARNLRAVVFDYGNTLIEFGPRQVAVCDEALAVAVSERFGPVDRTRLKAIRDRNRLAPYEGDPPEYRENDLREITSDLVRELYGLTPSGEDLDALARVRFDVFVKVVESPDGVPGLLNQLRRAYRLAMVSNYPDGEAIRASLDKIEWTHFFDTVVVSGDLGYAKPHPLPFETMLSAMGVRADEVLFVGDNWLGDVQGAKRAGMYAAHTIEWTPYERFDRKPGDFEADLVLNRLAELEAYV